MEQIKNLIRQIPDFPKPGVLFYDITTLLKNAQGLHLAFDAIADYYKNKPIDYVVGVEARGFIFAAFTAYQLNVGLIPARKAKKLPGEVASTVYNLEYGTQVIEIHKDAISKGKNILIIDDMLATGGTAAAVANLVESLGGKVVGVGFLVELTFLHGREKLKGYDVHSIIKY